MIDGTTTRSPIGSNQLDAAYQTVKDGETIELMGISVACIATPGHTPGSMCYLLDGNLVHFAAAKRHIGFYPGASGIAAFDGELTEYKHSKGAVQFPNDKPMPYELIREIVVFRIRENAEHRL